MSAATERTERLIPGGVPKHVRCYDNGGATLDRYTVIFTGRYPGKEPGYSTVLTMSTNPRRGVALLDSVYGTIDRPSYAHLGKRIKYEDLPEGCRSMVEREYRALWRIERPRPRPAPPLFSSTP